MAWRGQSLAAPVPLPGAGFVGPHPKTATVERREGSRSNRDRVVARRRRDRKNECACRRSIHPSSGVTCGHGTKGTTNPHASLRRGNDKGMLFDIVRKGHAASDGIIVSRASPPRPETQGHTSGSRFAILALRVQTQCCKIFDRKVCARSLRGRPKKSAVGASST